jgi:hypothetical protein
MHAQHYIVKSIFFFIRLLNTERYSIKIKYINNNNFENQKCTLENLSNAKYNIGLWWILLFLHLLIANINMNWNVYHLFRIIKLFNHQFIGLRA